MKAVVYDERTSENYQQRRCGYGLRIFLMCFNFKKHDLQTNFTHKKEIMKYENGVVALGYFR